MGLEKKILNNAEEGAECGHWAHRGRKDGRRSPREVLGWVTGMRYREEDLERAFFSVRFSRVLDPLGYATFRRWRLYGQPGRAMALGTDPHAGACRGSSLPIRGRARAGRRQTAGGEASRPVRDLARVDATEALPVGRFGRRGVAQGAQAGGVCAPETTRSTGLATGTLLLYGDTEAI